MKRTTLVAVLLAIPSAAWAADHEAGQDPTPETTASSSATPAEVVSAPVAASASTVASDSVVVAETQPEPIKGWSRGRRSAGWRGGSPPA